MLNRTASHSLPIALGVSIMIHLLAMSLLFIAPVKKERGGAPFFARLVTSEDIGPGAGTGEITAPKSIVVPKTALPAVKSRPVRDKSKSSSVKAESSSSSQPSVSSAKIPQATKGQGESVTDEKGEGTEGSNASKLNIPPGTGGGAFPLKKETLDMVQQGKVFSARQSAKEAGAIIAKKQEDSKEKSSLTFDAREFKYHGYMTRLKDKIEGIWHYPADAAMRGIYGDLYVEFTIRRDGSLGRVELVRTSGYKSLDDAAIKALKDAAPYWPLPDEWKQDALTIKGRFVYSLYGVYIR